jgi:hypothetical protein
MGHGPCTFKQTDATRLYKAAVAAGMPDPQIEMDLQNKMITVRSGAADAARVNSSTTSLDRELEEFAAW